LGKTAIQKYDKISGGSFAGALSFFSAVPAFVPFVPAILILSLVFSGSVQFLPGSYRDR
jgi:hypothetical protein